MASSSSNASSARLALTEEVLASYSPAAVHHDKEPAVSVKAGFSALNGGGGGGGGGGLGAGSSGANSRNGSLSSTSWAPPRQRTAPRPCSLSFSQDGMLLFSSQSDNSLLVFNTQTSKLVNSFRQLREGVDLVQPTQQQLTVVCSPASSDARKRNLTALGGSSSMKSKRGAASSLYIWSLHSNHILGYLRGHTSEIQSLHTSTIEGDEAIVSTSMSGEVCLWDVRQGDTCIAQARVGASGMGSSSGGGGSPAAACFSNSSDKPYLAVAGVAGRKPPNSATGTQHEVCIYDRRMLSTSAHGTGSWRPVSVCYSTSWEEASSPRTLSTMKMLGFSRIEFSADDSLLLVTPKFVPRPLLPGMADKQRRRGPLLAPHYVFKQDSATNGSFSEFSVLPADLDFAEDFADTVPLRGTGQKRAHHLRSVATFSPDSRSLIFGDTRNIIQVWGCIDEGTGIQTDADYDEIGKVRGGMKRVASWKGHIGAIGPIAWNPRSELVASGGGNLIMWLPKIDT